MHRLVLFLAAALTLVGCYTYGGFVELDPSELDDPGLLTLAYGSEDPQDWIRLDGELVESENGFAWTSEPLAEVEETRVLIHKIEDVDEGASIRWSVSFEGEPGFGCIYDGSGNANDAENHLIVGDPRVVFEGEELDVETSEDPTSNGCVFFTRL